MILIGLQKCKLWRKWVWSQRKIVCKGNPFPSHKQMDDGHIRGCRCELFADNQYSLLSVDADDRCSENISSTAVGISPRVCDSDAENMVQNVTEKVEEG